MHYNMKYCDINSNSIQGVSWGTAEKWENCSPRLSYFTFAVKYDDVKERGGGRNDKSLEYLYMTNL